MRVTHVMFSMYTGGAELLLIDIMRRQLQQGLEVSLLVINNQYDRALLATVPAAVEVVLLDRPEGSRNPLWLWRVNRALSRLRPDVVHCHNDNTAGLLVRRRGVRYCLTVHSTMSSSITRASLFDRVIAISRSVKRHIDPMLPLPSEVVYNGIDTDAVALREAGRHEPFRIVQVGRLQHLVKGQHLLLHAVAAIQDVTVDFVGEGRSLDYLRALAGELGLSNRVRFLGNRERAWIYGHLRDYDLLVQPSLTEGFGLAVAEAMAARLPVVACDLPGVEEVTGRNRYGRLFPTGDVDGLRKAIKEVMADYDACRSLACGDAFRRVADTFSIDATVRGYVAGYGA